jgi:hypothetical protein
MTSGEGPVHPNLRDALDDDIDAAAELDAVARRLGALDPADALEPPPAGLFEAIQAELAGDPQVADDGAVIELSSRRSRRPLLMVLGAAAAIAVVVGVAGVVLRDDPGATTEQVELAGLPDFADVTGSATLVIDGEDRSLGVDLSTVDLPAGSHLELWLLDPSVEQLVSLGPLTGDTPHAIPPEVDLSVTPVVDVSVEPDDGNPAHSGVSVVRGQIEPT